MEFVLEITLILGFLLTIIVMRYFFKRLSDKIKPYSDKRVQKTPLDTKIPLNMDIPHMQWQKESPESLMGNDFTQMDKPSPNEIAEDDPSEVDYDENIYVPADVKVEVEGGDTAIPPGYEATAN